MKPLLTALLISAGLAVGQVTTEPDSLNEHLRPLKPYLNKTYIGHFTQEPGQPATTDVARWERILNGQAIRMLHSVNDGEYGGETILFWDKSRQSLVYYYFTTAGFFTNGTMILDGDKWVSHEMVSNNGNGITEVRSTSQFLPNGGMHTVAEFKQNGQWVHGHTIDYVESPESRMVFR